MTEPVFRGVAVALVTIFNDDAALSVDAPATAALATQLVDAGVAAVVVAGTTGEAAALSLAERVELISAVRAAVPRSVPVIAGAGAAWSGLAAAYTFHAGHAGADAVLVLSPPTIADPRPYYDEVAKAAAPASLPVLAYHFPAVSSPGIGLQYLAELPVVGLKDSTGDPSRLLAEATLLGWDRPVYPGSSALISYGASIGCPGVILALANAEPEGCVAAWAGGTGDGVAQLALAGAHDRLGRGHLKAMTAERFGTSTVRRVA